MQPKTKKQAKEQRNTKWKMRVSALSIAGIQLTFKKILAGIQKSGMDRLTFILKLGNLHWGCLILQQFLD
jgi:hypothetical protein